MWHFMPGRELNLSARLMRAIKITYSALFVTFRRIQSDFGLLLSHLSLVLEYHQLWRVTEVLSGVT